MISKKAHKQRSNYYTVSINIFPKHLLKESKLYLTFPNAKNA